ncbi:MAG: hypothetical protein WBD46_15165 [Acidobacteriaceae bacterium]
MNVTRISSAACVLLTAVIAFPVLAAAQTTGTVLHAAEASKILPDTVYFAGQSATTQMRNSAGMRLPDGHHILAVLVDTSGYSSTVKERYQGYLLAEVPLSVGGHTLPAGAYGMGFVGGNFLVMDIGDHTLLKTASSHDAQMQRPMPLQILDGSQPGSWRLCFGRDCVDFRMK